LAVNFLPLEINGLGCSIATFLAALRESVFGPKWPR
jgi:hypothetical protein